MNEDLLLKKFEELGIMAKAMGFNYVDLYVPDKEESGELIAFTFSKSKKYIDKVSELESE